MGSFGGFTRFRTGYWLGIREWLLREAVNIPHRIKSIQVERERFGYITVTYEAIETDTGKYRTEKRLNFSVTEGSSLEGLVMAYIMVGGNPYDISMFMHPNETKAIEVIGDGEIKEVEKYPYGGLIAPVSRVHPNSSRHESNISKTEETIEELDWGSDAGGMLNVKKYQPARLVDKTGQPRLVWNKEHTIMADAMHKLRGWANQEIAEKLHLLEHKIIKLCDLSEQLEQEIETLTKAFGGAVSALLPFWLSGSFDESELGGEEDAIFDPSAKYFLKSRVQSLVYDYDRTFFHTDEENQPVLSMPRFVINEVWAYKDDKTEGALSMMF